MPKKRGGRPARNDPHMNMGFYDDNLEFCKAMAEKEHLSTTQYVNQLITKEKKKHDPAEWKLSAGKENLT